MELTSDFECGSGRLMPRGENAWRLETTGDLFGYDKYFCIRIRSGPTDPPRLLRLEIVSDASLGGKSHFMTHFPSHLWYTDQEWTRWRPLRNTWEDAVRFLDERIEVSLPVPPGRTIYLATNAPRRYSDMVAWSRQLRPRAADELGHESIGESVEGRQIPVFRLGTPGGAKLLVLAGQHSSEHSGVWASEGIVEYLLSSIREARDFTKRFDVAVIPMLNPDGNARGYSGGNAQRLTINNSLDFLDASEGRAPRTRENHLLWTWLTEHFQPSVLLHFHGYMGWKKNADHPYDGVYVLPESDPLFRDPVRAASQRAILDRILFETPGFSAHWRTAGEVTREMLDFQLARKFGTIGILYEVNTGAVGPSEQFRRGPQVFAAVARGWLDARSDGGSSAGVSG